jgi:hypothetical protein
MRSRIATATAALVLGLAAIAAAQSLEPGTVVRVDPQSSLVLLDDGRMYRVTPGTVVVVDNRPAAIATLRPGQRVVIHAGEMVTYRDGQYVRVAPAPGASAIAPAPTAPAPVLIAQAPSSPPPVTAVPAGVRQTIYGTITDVEEKDGEVKIRTQRDSFEIKMAPEALRRIKKGDNVVIDLMITPPGAPAASPPTTR